MERDLRIFSHENVLEQLNTAVFSNGFYVLEFYADRHKPVTRVTASIERFYLYPSGGTLRDCNFHLLFYDSRYDTYRGFKPPHLRGT